MASFACTLDRIKQDLQPHLSPDMIENACREAGHIWRERKLGPVQTIHLFILQILHLNTAIRHLRHLAKTPVNAAAYCRARMRLPLGVLQELLRTSSTALRQSLGGECGAELTRWRGHRTFLLDGTGMAVPDTRQLCRIFKRPKGRNKGPGLPVPKIIGLFDAMTGLVVEVMAFALFVHEASKVWLLHPLLMVGDLVVGDRGFCSFAHLAMLSARGVLGLLRVNQRVHIVSFRYRRKHYERRRGNKARLAQRGRPRSKWVRRLGHHDQLVRWIKPKFKAKVQGRKAWMTRKQYDALPEELQVRELRYQVSEKGHRSREVTVATTLVDPLLYPRDAIAQLYGIRWRVETHLRELKTTLKMDRLKCQTEAGVRKELAAYCLAYNLVHAVMAKAAARQATTPDRISFIDALRWLLTARPGEELTTLIVNPIRPGRYHPRVLKHTSRTFPKMTRPRHEYRLRLATKREWA